ncbi:PucR family transcriptional regulator [Celerinatantimonas yamalensis]|uniref:PucR family transcriptional regulator n=1 Tax=Celerinatantimonas yamalensis TaxID=559956 RepID=A0ABW9G6M6_9GAMM
MLTVRDIPSIQGLQSIQIRAGMVGIDKAIRWPYIAEDHELAPWLVGGEVIFITGINRSWSNSSFQRLLQVTQAKNVAAIVVLTGSRHIPSLSPEWMALANQFQIPLLEQPYSLAMVTVTERLSNAIVQESFAQRSKQWFLLQLIENPSLPEAITLEQAKGIGLPINSLLSVAMVLPNASVSDHIDFWSFTLREFLVAEHSPFPLIEYRTGWLLILPLVDECHTQDVMPIWQQLHHTLKRRQLPSTIGVSHGQSLKQLNLLIRQARQCSEFIYRHHRGQLFHHKTFALQQLFTAVDDVPLLQHFCRRMLGALYQTSDRELLFIKQTLANYFASLCSVRRTAQQMGIHRNTVSARLQKFEQLTHLSLADAGHRLAVQNALQIDAFILPPDES